VAGRWFCTSLRGKIVFLHPISFTSTVERTGQAVRGGVKIAGRYSSPVIDGVLAGLWREG
jgi:hypothetical protein